MNWRTIVLVMQKHEMEVSYCPRTNWWLLCDMSVPVGIRPTGPTAESLFRGYSDVD